MPSEFHSTTGQNRLPLLSRFGEYGFETAAGKKILATNKYRLSVGDAGTILSRPPRALAGEVPWNDNVFAMNSQGFDLDHDLRMAPGAPPQTPPWVRTAEWWVEMNFGFIFMNLNPGRKYRCYWTTFPTEVCVAYKHVSSYYVHNRDEYGNIIPGYHLVYYRSEGWINFDIPMKVQSESVRSFYCEIEARQPWFYFHTGGQPNPYNTPTKTDTLFDWKHFEQYAGTQSLTLRPRDASGLSDISWIKDLEIHETSIGAHGLPETTDESYTFHSANDTLWLGGIHEATEDVNPDPQHLLNVNQLEPVNFFNCDGDGHFSFNSVAPLRGGATNVAP